MDLEAGSFIAWDHAEPIPDQNLDRTWPAADTFTDHSIARRTLHTFEAGSSINSDDAELNPGKYLDWTLPAVDTFTDDSIARRTFHTCSELGSWRIRLIKIRSGSSNATIQCDTKVCFLSQAEDYTALSYTWGCPVERCQIIVDGQPRRITENLWQFLWQAREFPAQFSGWLWIDALSIEQSDPWEKLEQVKIISSIFRSAAQVVIWLGPAYGNSDKAMKALADQRTTSPHWKTPRILSASPVGPAMLEMCERPYWRRLWVYQEMRASQMPYVLCGSQHVSLEPLKSLLQYRKADERIETVFRILKSSFAAKMVRLSQCAEETSLGSILCETSHLLCTDPRDKVYAILNTVSRGHRGIEADYTKPLPELVNQVLRNMHDIGKQFDMNEINMQCLQLGSLFEMHPGLIYTSDKEMAACPEPLKFLCGVTKKELLEDKTYLIVQVVHAWCKRYNHVAVGQVVRRSLPRHWGLSEPDLRVGYINRRLTGVDIMDLATLRMYKAIALALKSFESFFEKKEDIYNLSSMLS